MRKRDPRFKDAQRHKKPIDKSKARKTAKKYFTPDDFKLDEETRTLICPGRKILTMQSRNIRLSKGLYGVSYAAKARDCMSCSLKYQCMQNPLSMRGRQVYKFEGHDETKKPKTFSGWMRERIDSEAGRYLYSLRMGIVEPVFANIRDKLGLAKFTLRGKLKVNAQWLMYAIVHNLLKAYRFGWLASANRQARAAPA